MTVADPALVKRLKRIEGQVRGLVNMVVGGRRIEKLWI